MVFSTTKFNPEKQVGGFSRDNRDNKLFKELQVKDLSTVTTDDVIFVWDHDGVPFKCAGMVEDDYIVATNVETKETREAKNVTTFWGVGKNVGANSEIGIENIKRAVEGLPELTKESFTIEKKKKLKTKFINSKTGLKFKNPKKDEDGKVIEGSGDPLELKQRVDMDISDVIEIMEARIDEVRKQWSVKNFLMCLGSGEVFRDLLKLPEPYKGQRDPLRPIFLKEARQYIIDTYPSEIAPPLKETDDVVEWYGALSHANWRKEKKHTHVIIGEDKDLASNPKIWVNYGRDGGFFKQPQAVLIPDSSVSVGTLELVQKSTSTETKGTGLVWLVMQAFCFGDNSDNYHPYLKLDKSLRSHIKYGQKEAYIDFVKLTTPLEVLQKAVDNMYLWFPDGLKYLAHDNTEQDIDTYTWMADVCYPVAYMTRTSTDVADFRKLCEYFKVDVSKITGNHRPPVHPLAEEQAIRDNLETLKKEITYITEVSSNKKGKVSDKDARFDEIKEMLESLKQSLDSFYVID